MMNNMRVLKRVLAGLLAVLITTTAFFWVIPYVATNVDRNTYSQISIGLIPEHVYRDMYVGDLNSDQLDDVVLTGFQSLQIAMQNQSGEFQLSTLLDARETYGGLVVTDLDGDATPDICCRNNTSSFVVLYNDGSADFTNRSFYSVDSAQYIRSLFPFHLEDENRTDIGLSLSGDDYRICLYSNNGHGDFSLNLTISCSSIPVAVTGVDLDQNGRGEIAMLHNDGNFTVVSSVYPSNASLFINIGQWIGYIDNAWILPVDLDDDSTKDFLVVVNDGPRSSRIVFLRTSATGFSGSPVVWSFASAFLGASLADLDNDGDSDFIFTQLSGVTTVFENDQNGIPNRHMILPSQSLPHSPTTMRTNLSEYPSVAVINQVDEYLVDYNHMEITVFSRQTGVLAESTWFASQFMHNPILLTGRVASAVTGIALIIIVVKLLSLTKRPDS